jgi:hypothetical protein
MGVPALCPRAELLGVSGCGEVLRRFVRSLHCSARSRSSGRQAVQQPGLEHGTVSGTVVDTDGDAIAGAQVTLSGSGLDPDRKLLADRDGYFIFTDVPPGSLTLTIAYAGFGAVVKTITVHAAENLSVPDTALTVRADMEVEVSPLSQHDLAEIDLKAEEHQRLGGVIPNFYVAYNWHASPLTAGQKFKLAYRASIDPATFGLAAVYAGVEQATNGFKGYGQGAQGYGKRFGAAMADSTVGTFVGGAIFPVLLRQDPRFFYKSTGTIMARALYALSTAVICKGDNGKWQPNYSSVLGDVSAGAVSNTYYPDTDRNGWLLVVENGLLNAAEDGIGNLLQEFLFKRITPGSRNAGTDH